MAKDGQNHAQEGESRSAKVDAHRERKVMTAAQSASAMPIPAHVPPERVLHFDFRNDEQLQRDPWAYLNEMNDGPDIFFSSDLGGYWVVTRKELIDEVYTRHDLFTAKSLAVPKIENPVPLIPNLMDPPEHTKYRKFMVDQLFSPRALATLEEDVRARTIALAEGFAAKGHCEFVNDYAYLLPIDVTLDYMGADPSLRGECLSFIKKVFRGKSLADTEEGFMEAHGFLTRWLEEQLANPDANQGKWFRGLVEGRFEGRPLNYDEIFAMTLMLYMGGLDTVTSQMTHFMKFLAESPEHRQYLVDRPQRIPNALEEMLRRFGISYIGRMVAKDVVYRGVQLKAGDPIIAGTPISGLDRIAFPDPLRVDFSRGHGRVKHGAFGAGPHLCAGALLARTQLRVMLEELLPRMPNLRIAPGAEVLNMPGATMMLASLPLEWDS